MRRLLALTFVVPAVLTAAEQAKPQPGLLDRALTRGVTNDRPYRPTSRFDAQYQAVRAVIARTENQLMAGTLRASPDAEIAAVRTAIESEVTAIGAITEHERHQYEEAVRDLNALIASMGTLGINSAASPGVIAPATDVATTTPAAVEVPAEKPAQTPAEAPVEKPTEVPVEKPADTPVEQTTETPAEKPTEAAVEKPADTPTEAPLELPAETPAQMPTEAPAELPVEQPAVVPTDTPAETPVEKPVEVPAEVVPEKPAETPAEVAPEKPAETPAEKPAEAPADALPPE